jgi:putative NIF3 family GTP cyclohydrolase 1 type 2
VRRIVSGVTASRALIEAAIAPGRRHFCAPRPVLARPGRPCDRLDEAAPGLLLAHDINLLAYHLPLDAHAELGNNAQLGRVLGLRADTGRFGEQDLGFLAKRPTVAVRRRAGWPGTWKVLGRPVTLVDAARRPLSGA